MIRACFLGLVILCLQMEYVRSQTPDFNALDIGAFSEKMRVEAFAQDENHNLYIGTAKQGIYKYDGYTLNRLNLPDSLSDMVVSSLLYYRDQLWIGTTSGMLYLWKSGEIRAFPDSNYSPSAKISKLRGFNNYVGIATYGDGVYLTADEKVVKHFTTENGLGDDYTYDLDIRSERLWVGTDAGISEIDTVDYSSISFSMKNGLPDNIVLALEPINDSMLAVGMYERGVCFLNTRSFQFSYLDSAKSWSHGRVTNLLHTTNDRIWVGTKSDGLIWMDKKDDGNFMLRSLSEINGLESNKIQILFSDAEKNIWVGTDRGVSVYTNPPIEYLTSDEGLMAKNVYDVLVANANDYWLATDQGVVQFEFDKNGEGHANIVLASSENPAEQIVSLYLLESDKMLMGSYGAGLFEYDLNTGRVKNYGLENGLVNLSILDIAADTLGNVWLATLGGGVVCAMENSDQELAFHQVKDQDTHINQYVYSLFVDDDQQLWVGTDGAGIAAMDCASEQFRMGFEALPKDITVYSICQDKEGAVWFCSDDDRLFQFSSGQLIDRTDDLATNGQTIQGLAVNQKGEVIALHVGGIEVLTPGKKRFEMIKPARDDFDFMPNLNAITTQGNDMWIGTESGAIKLLRGNTEFDQVSPKVNLIGLNVLYEKYALDASKQFDYDQSHFVFEYKAVYLRNPSAVRYEYMLEGFDKKWSFPTETKLARYSSLPPGDYTFKVRASSDGVHWSNPEITEYSFSILKPFWMQWWFYVLMAILLLGGMRVLVVYRTKKLIADKEALELEVEKRTAEITKQKEIIEHKSDEIMASITYAKRIQTAILPPSSFIKSNLPNSFVLYKPKDIVAGDFYWMTCVEDLTIFAAADCTGHGVPGAMVSVVCSNALNRAVLEYGLTDPAKILFKTRELVIERFERQSDDQSSGDTIKDGMDVALCAMKKNGNTLYFAGAQNPLWVVSDREDMGAQMDSSLETESGLWLHEFKPDKQPIGKYAEIKPFTTRTLELQAGDVFYLFTDGYADQFGGPRGKKFKYKPFKHLLGAIADKEMLTQKEALNAHFEKWQGDHEQVDDVCVIGVKV